MATETQTIATSATCLSGIVTAAEYNTFTGVASPANSAQIQAAIYDATEYVMERTSRWFVPASSAITVVEMFDGNGRNRYYPKQGPVISFGIIELWNGTSWDTIDATVYEPETDGNKVWFRQGYVFARGKENWRITYSFGFLGGIPRDLKRAVMELARYYVVQRQDNLRSESNATQSFSYDTPKFPNAPNEVIDRYTRYGTIG